MAGWERAVFRRRLGRGERWLFRAGAVVGGLVLFGWGEVTMLWRAVVGTAGDVLVDVGGWLADVGERLRNGPDGSGSCWVA